MEYTIIDTSKILGVVCAGGDGTRIEPLSRHRAKPAIPIGGNNRLVDIMLSNLLNSVVTHIYVIVQRRPHSLISHLEGYSNGIAQMRGQFIRVLSPPKEEERFFMSDADSLLQLRNTLLDSWAEIFIVVMADQVVKIDFRQVVQAMLSAKADAAMVYRSVPIHEARNNLGVLEIGSDSCIIGMEEKPSEPKEIHGKPGMCNANLAMYVFQRSVFIKMLDAIGKLHKPSDTLSNSGIPWLLKNFKVFAYDLERNEIPGAFPNERGFFADTGSVEAWYSAQMEMCKRHPVFNFYSLKWPIYTAPYWPTSPAKFDFVARINQTLFGPNAICQDGVIIEHSVVSAGVVVGHHSSVTNSVVLNDTVIGPGCKLDRVILDKEVHVPAGITLNPEYLPQGTIKFADLYSKIKNGEPVENVPVLSERGILVFPKRFSFT